MRLSGGGRRHCADALPGGAARPIDSGIAAGTFTLTAVFCGLVYATQIEISGARFWSLPSGFMLRDFAFFWGGARLAWLGHAAAVFHPGQFNAWLIEQIAPGTIEPFATWSYPPTMLLPLLPFGLLPVSTAMVIWLSSTFTVLTLVLRWIFRDWLIVAAVLLSPAAWYCISFAQNGALTAALLVGGLWLVDRRPVVGGVCIGLLTIKPQLGILLPFALIAGGHWRALASAVVVSFGAVALTIVLFGVGPWIGFWGDTMPTMTAQLLHDYGIMPQHAMPTTLVTLQGWGMPTALASCGQGFSTLLAIAAVVWAWRRHDADRNWRNVLTCSMLLVATPFGYVYDMMPTMLAVVLLARAGLHSGFKWSERPILVAVWVWPAVSVAWTHYLGWRPLGAFALLALAQALVSRIAEVPAAAGTTSQSYSVP